VVSLIIVSMPDHSTSVIITSNSPSKSNHNGVGKTNVDVLLVYPFVYDVGNREGCNAIVSLQLLL
jgi:hypothetical protein